MPLLSQRHLLSVCYEKFERIETSQFHDCFTKPRCYIKSIEKYHLMIGTSVIFIESCFMVSAMATEIPS